MITSNYEKEEKITATNVSGRYAVLVMQYQVLKINVHTVLILQPIILLSACYYSTK